MLLLVPKFLDIELLNDSPDSLTTFSCLTQALTRARAGPASMTSNYAVCVLGMRSLPRCMSVWTRGSKQGG